MQGPGVVLVGALFAAAVGGAIAWKSRPRSTGSIEQLPPPSWLPGPGFDMTVLDVSSWRPHPNAAPYIDRVRAAESRYGIPHNLLARLIEQESAWNPNAFNGASGASGIAQIVHRWHPNVSDPFDPSEAIDYAGKYLRELYDNFGTWPRALAAYNWGWGNVDNWIAAGEKFRELPRETQNYVTRITKDVPA